MNSIDLYISNEKLNIRRIFGITEFDDSLLFPKDTAKRFVKSFRNFHEKPMDQGKRVQPDVQWAW